HSEGVIKPPRNARFYLDGKRVAVEPSTEGVGIDASEGLSRLRKAVAGFERGPIEIPTTAVPPELTTADLESLLDRASALASTPLLLVDEGQAWQLTPADLVPLLRV